MGGDDSGSHAVRGCTSRGHAPRPHLWTETRSAQKLPRRLVRTHLPTFFIRGIQWNLVDMNSRGLSNIKRNFTISVTGIIQCPGDFKWFILRWCFAY